VKLKRLVFVSSLAASGPSGKGEVKDENSPCEPVTDYGRSKLKAENYLSQFGEELPYTILRLGLVYGPRNRHGIFSLFQIISRRFRPILKHARTNVVYVKDVASCCLLAARRDEAICRIYCVGENHIYSYRDVAHAVSDAVGGRMINIPVSMPLLFGAGLILQLLGRITGTVPLLDLRRMSDMRHRYWMYDTSAVARDLGYETGYDLREGARETVKWYREQGWIK
jgi:nucleoside-diphosphate-sugar epimerase